MRLTTRGRYAVTAMLDLAMYQRDRPMTLSEIATRQGISRTYLEQLFSQLRRGKLVSSTRGPGGGYRLSRDAAEISIAEVIAAVHEGREGSRSQNRHRGEHPSVTQDLWRDLSERIQDYLRRISLRDLMEHGKGAHQSPTPIHRPTRRSSAPAGLSVQPTRTL